MPTHAGTCQNMLKYVNICKHILTYARYSSICWHMLAYAFIFSHMLACASMCWHVLVYGSICQHMQAYVNMLAYVMICCHLLANASKRRAPAYDSMCYHMLECVRICWHMGTDLLNMQIAMPLDQERVSALQDLPTDWMSEGTGITANLNKIWLFSFQCHLCGV